LLLLDMAANSYAKLMHAPLPMMVPIRAVWALVFEQY